MAARVHSVSLVVLGLVIGLLVVVVVDRLDNSAEGATRQGANQADCPWLNTRTAVGRPKPPLRRTRELTPAEGSAQRAVNVGGDRDKERVPDIRLDLSRPVPPRVKPWHFEIYADPLVRTSGEALETVSFPEPSFTRPQLVNGRSRVRFTLCLDPRDLPAGKYTGLVNIQGPRNITATTMAVTANVKDATLFWVGTAAALVVALLTLLFKGAADQRALLRDAPTEAEPNPPWPSWSRGLRGALGDPQFMFTSLVAIAAAFGALYTLYANDASWGASGLSSVFALLVAAFAAVGGQTLLAGLRQGSGAGRT